ncbi:extracellular solute-binding protein [Haladaptatus sp. NG-SE-30]
MTGKVKGLNRRQYLELAGMAGLAGLAGCTSSDGNNKGDGSGNGDKSNGSKKMTMWAWNDQALAPIRKKQLKTFKNQTGVSANWQYYPWDNYLTKLLTSISSGDAPETFASATVWVPELASRDSAKNLSKSSGVEVPELINAATRNSSYKGDLYSVPWYADCRALCINKDMFKEAGIEVPSDNTKAPSWDKFAMWVNELSTKDRAGYVMDPGEGFEGLMLSNGGNYLESVGDAKFKVKFNDDSAIETAQYVMDDLGMDNIARADEDLEQFLSGNAAMTYAGSWELDQLKKADINYMYLPQPKGPNGKTSRTWSAGVYYCAPPKASEQALKWLDFVMSKEQQTKVVKTVGGFPGRADVYETDAFKETVSGDPTMKLIAQEMQKAVPLPRIVGAVKLLNEIGRPAIQRVYQGQASPEKAFDQAAKQMVTEFDQIVEK